MKQLFKKTCSMRLIRVERKCDIILSELRMLRRLHGADSTDEALAQLNVNTKRLVEQGEKELQAINELISLR